MTHERTDKSLLAFLTHVIHPLLKNHITTHRSSFTIPYDKKEGRTKKGTDRQTTIDSKEDEDIFVF